LGVRHVAGQMKRKILARSVPEQMISSNHSREDDRRDVGIVTLPNEILIRFQIPDAIAKRIDGSRVLRAQARMFLQFTNEKVKCFDRECSK
jgi:hypothetical protein